MHNTQKVGSQPANESYLYTMCSYSIQYTYKENMLNYCCCIHWSFKIFCFYLQTLSTKIGQLVMIYCYTVAKGQICGEILPKFICIAHYITRIGDYTIREFSWIQDHTVYQKSYSLITYVYNKLLVGFTNKIQMIFISCLVRFGLQHM